MNRDRDWIKDQFKKAVYNYIPIESAAQRMYESKLNALTEEDWKKLEVFLEDLQFPLTLYRGIYVKDGSDVETAASKIGVNWTVDDTLFYTSSAFNNINVILQGEVDQQDVNWPETIQNYIYYSLRPSYGLYPENEVTLLKNHLPKNLEILEKQAQ